MALNKRACLYCITNTVNGKKYVGKTNNSVRRWRDHRNAHNDIGGKQYNKVLYAAMRKYGVANFKFEILQEYPSERAALDDEDNWIDKLQSRVTQNGYNCVKGGSGSDTYISRPKSERFRGHTKESKAKMSKTMAEVHKEKRDPLIAVLKELHDQGLNNVEIQKEMGIPHPTVRTWIRLLGLKSNAIKRPVKEAVPEIEQLAKSGKTVKQISRIAKVRSITVRKILLENGWPINRERMGVEKGRINPEFEAKKQWAIPIIIEMCDQGKGKREIRDRVKMGIHFVARTMREHKASKKNKDDK